jgi:phosphatidylglycerol:prolipoprotein diacylglycerol transferase
MHPFVVVGAEGAFGFVAGVLLAVAAPALGWSSSRAPSARARVVRLFAAYACATAALGLFVLRLEGARVAISSYAIAVVAGAMVAWAVLLRRLTGRGYPLRLVFSIIAGCLAFGVVGARLAQLASDAASGSATGALHLRQAGLGVFGAFAVDVVFLALLLRRFPPFTLAGTLDAGASAVALNLAAGRVGCLLAGCCFGAPAASSALSLPVSVFAPGSPAAAHYAGASAGARIWATQPLEAAGALALALLCEALYARRARLRLADGAVIASGAAAYGLLRALLEAVRADSPRFVGGRFTPWQLASAALVACAAAWLLARGRTTPASSPAA